MTMMIAEDEHIHACTTPSACAGVSSGLTMGEKTHQFSILHLLVDIEVLPGEVALTETAS
jgi:hypothetical protein